MKEHLTNFAMVRHGNKQTNKNAYNKKKQTITTTTEREREREPARETDTLTHRDTASQTEPE